MPGTKNYGVGGMTDIATTLVFWKDDDRIPACIHGDLQKAADEIERLTVTCMADDALIKQQQAEIERLDRQLQDMTANKAQCDDTIMQQKAEIERLTMDLAESERQTRAQLSRVMKRDAEIERLYGLRDHWTALVEEHEAEIERLRADRDLQCELKHPGDWTMTDILIERLREVQGNVTMSYRNPDGPEAADEIERLTCALTISRGKHENAIAEIERLQAVVDVLEAFLDGDIGYEPLEEALAALKDENDSQNAPRGAFKED